MTSETYRGVRLRAVTRRGRDWGTVDYYVNGKKWGAWRGQDEAEAITLMKRYVDAAANRPGSNPTFEPAPLETT